MTLDIIAHIDDPESGPGTIPIHGPGGFEGMRRAGRLAAAVLDYLTPEVKPEVSTDYLDMILCVAMARCLPRCIIAAFSAASARR
jgi:hypothetical protein